MTIEDKLQSYRFSDINITLTPKMKVPCEIPHSIHDIDPIFIAGNNHLTILTLSVSISPSVTCI